MNTFALLASELPTTICRPQVRRVITSTLEEVKSGGRFRVPGWSLDGVRVVLNSGVCQFRMLYLVTAERCDCGELHTNDALYCVAYRPGEHEQAIREVQEQIGKVANHYFDDQALREFDDTSVIPPEGVAAGIIIYDDPEEKNRDCLFFTNQALPAKAGVGIMCQAIKAYFTEEGEESDD